MELFEAMMTKTFELFNKPISLFGFQFSFFNVFMFVVLSCLVGLFIRGLFGGSD